MKSPSPLAALSVVLASVLFTTVASAQVRFEGQATWRWYASVDAGQSWQTDEVSVPPGVSSVRIRPIVEWSGINGPRLYFGRTQADFTVTKIGATTTADDISNVVGVHIAFNNPGAWRDSVFGNVVKMDDSADGAPPGLGPYWLVIDQPPPQQIALVSLANPFALLEYTLVLDGTPGDRLIDAVFRPLDVLGVPLSRHVVIYDLRFDQPSGEVYPTLSYQPLVLHVVPAPGAGAGVLLAVGAACPRRRNRR